MKQQKNIHNKGSVQQGVEAQEEILDIVDKNDHVIESLPRSVVYARQLFTQMRSIWLLIKNEKGQFWIPRRAYDRKILPGYLDGSVVGHVQAGENYKEALIRETYEEVGFDITTKSYRYLGKLSPHVHHTFCFAAVYECTVKVAPRNWNQYEFCEWSWVTLEQLRDRISAGELVKDTLSVILQEFYKI